ncbi:TolC family protein [Desulfuromonas sp. AOP6]|uniref:TolC family protein n=1 Tax=Desulfuromonas sp. AOP6 TaxID=1566351 RepID=UPI001BD04F83|nr:TolC family protein [Desulfuromonas sp. AOP6]
MFLFFLLSLPTTIWAEALDFSTALQEAIQSRPFAAAARKDAEAAVGAAGEARSRYLPSLTFSERFTWTNEPGSSLFISLNQEDLLIRGADYYNNPDDRKDFETRFDLNQVLYDPDVSYGYRRAQKGAAAANEQARWAEEEAGFALLRAYLGLQQAVGAQDWAASARRQAEEVLRLAQERQAAGLGLKADTLQAAVFLADAQRQERRASNDVAQARQALALALGRDGSDVSLGSPLRPEDFPDPVVDSEIDRGDIRALFLREEEARLAVKQSRAAYFPKVGLGASYVFHDGSSPLGTEAESWMLHAGLTWELFDGFRRSQSRSRAEATREAVQWRRQEAVRQAALQSDEAGRRIEEARLNLETARQSEVQGAESLRLLRERYAEGLTDMADLLAAQTAVERIRLESIQAEAQLIFSLASRHFQQGTFLQTFLPTEEMNP